MTLERPIRDYEIVTDIMATWEEETTCALLVKRYGYRDSLTADVRWMYKLIHNIQLSSYE
jgi:hypothetical protein